MYCDLVYCDIDIILSYRPALFETLHKNANHGIQFLFDIIQLQIFTYKFK